MTDTAVYAAGGVIWRLVEGKLLILVIHVHWLLGNISAIALDILEHGIPFFRLAAKLLDLLELPKSEPAEMGGEDGRCRPSSRPRSHRAQQA